MVAVIVLTGPSPSVATISGTTTIVLPPASGGPLAGDAIPQSPSRGTASPSPGPTPSGSPAAPTGTSPAIDPAVVTVAGEVTAKPGARSATPTPGIPTPATTPAHATMPTPTPAPTASPSPVASPTPTPTASGPPTPTPTPAPSGLPTLEPTPLIPRILPPPVVCPILDVIDPCP